VKESYEDTRLHATGLFYDQVRNTIEKPASHLTPS
jgi:hypothetical protein